MRSFRRTLPVQLQKIRPVQTDTSQRAKLLPIYGLPFVLHAPSSRRLYVRGFLHTTSFHIAREYIREDAISSVFLSRANIPSERCKIHAVVESALVDARRSFAKWTRKRKIFRVASGQVPANGRRGVEWRDSGNEKARGCCRMQRKEGSKKVEDARREKYESEQELLQRRVYEVPVDRMPSKRGNTFLPLRKEKSVILSCVTRITRGELFARARGPLGCFLSRQR